MSYYLDDMHLTAGQQVRCKEPFPALCLTAGKVYTIEIRDYGSRHNMVQGIINDRGEFIVPSARFDKLEN